MRGYRMWSDRTLGCGFGAPVLMFITTLKARITSTNCSYPETVRVRGPRQPDTPKPLTRNPLVHPPQIP